MFSGQDSSTQTVELQNIQDCAIELILNYGYGARYAFTTENVKAVIDGANNLKVSRFRISSILPNASVIKNFD